MAADSGAGEEFGDPEEPPSGCARLALAEKAAGVLS